MLNYIHLINHYICLFIINSCYFDLLGKLMICIYARIFHLNYCTIDNICPIFRSFVYHSPSLLHNNNVHSISMILGRFHSLKILFLAPSFKHLISYTIHNFILHFMHKFLYIFYNFILYIIFLHNNICQSFLFSFLLELSSIG